jgi:hypothetical protein
MRQRRNRWYAWWYLAISAGFVLLAINRALYGEKPWLIGLRIVIAAVFAVLAAIEFHARDRNR